MEYESRKMEYGKLIKVKSTDIKLKRYQSIWGNSGNTSRSHFESSIAFFDDVFDICDELKKYQDKKEKVIEYAKTINENLPATAYIPFSKSIVFTIQIPIGFAIYSR